VKQDFHFSPRPNRAAEISWRRWEPAAFEEARTEDKPLLLAISAVWCHWCHVMDETTYSDEAVIRTINERYIPVRVDNDRRPDINARYNMGGWPTTALLTPDGSILTGATYVPPQQMQRLLEQIETFYRENKADIQERIPRPSESKRFPQTGESSELRASIVTAVLQQIRQAYDSEYGGFGSEPKFPQTDLLELLLLEHRVSGDSSAYEMAAKTMLGMSRGGMYDHVEGGFFRYSTTRDWSVPHFEKMAEDHAGLMRALTGLIESGKNPEFAATLKSTLGYLQNVLLDPQTGFFAGSQDADEAYYALPLEERRAASAPYVDRTVYANWNADLAAALLGAARVTEDPMTLSIALRVLEGLNETFVDESGLLYHYAIAGEKPQTRGLLTDQSKYLRALLDAYETTGESKFLQRGANLADVVIARFVAQEGGFYDRLSDSEELGRLAIKDRPLAENALMAASLLRLAALTGDDAYRARAERTLAVYARTYGSAGTFAAPYAMALQRFLGEPLSVVLVGAPAQTEELREAAYHLPAALVDIRTVDPKDGASMRVHGFEDLSVPSAILCRGTACTAPVNSAEDLRLAFDKL